MRDFWFAEEINPEVWDYVNREPNLVFWLERRRDRGQQGDDIWSTLSAEKIEQLQLAYRPHWPVVPLPSSWGTGSPRGETAYRYLRDSVWQIGRDEPSVALQVIKRPLAKDIIAPSYNDLRSIRAELRSRSAVASATAACSPNVMRCWSLLLDRPHNRGAFSKIFLKGFSANVLIDYHGSLSVEEIQ